MTEERIRVELEALRQEIAELRAARAETAAPGDAPPGREASACEASCKAALDQASSLLHMAADHVRTTTTSHPIPAVVASLAIGFLMGRLVAR